MWIKACGKEDVLSSDAINTAKFYDTHRVCGLHFEDDMYNNPVEKSRLLPTAVPTPFRELLLGERDF